MQNALITIGTLLTIFGAGLLTIICFEYMARIKSIKDYKKSRIDRIRRIKSFSINI